MAEKTFMFVGGAGTQLTGHLEPPEGTPRGWAIFAHCFTCGKDSRAAVHVSRALSRSGIGVLRFDFAGTGISGGMGGEVSFASDVQDLRSAATAMAAAGMSPSLLVGHSLGGTAAIIAAADLPDVAAVATIGAPADLQHILRFFGPNDLDTIASEGEASVDIAGRPFVIRRSFLEALEEIDVEKALATLRRPVLVMHSPLDQVVGIDQDTDPGCGERLLALDDEGTDALRLIEPQPEEARQQLSLQRAQTAKDLLVSMGVDAARITTEGVGTNFAGFANDLDANGNQIEAIAAKNRSVIVTVDQG